MKKGLLAVALLGLSLVAGSALAEPKPVIGALIRNLDDQFLGDYTGNLKKLAVSKGVELKVMDAHSDMATQLDQLNTLISQGVKYFVVVPAVTEGSEQLASIIAAKKGGAAFSNTAPTVAERAEMTPSSGAAIRVWATRSRCVFSTALAASSRARAVCSALRYW